MGKQQKSSRKQDIFEYVDKLAETSFELEQRREDSLIGQASNMLSAISIYTATLGVIFAAVLEHFKNLSKAYVIITSGLIALPIIASFILALLAQWRYTYDVFSSPMKIFDDAKKYYTKGLYDDLGKLRAKISLMERVYKTKSEINDKRAKLIKASEILMFIAIGLFILFSIVAGVVLYVK